MPRDRSEVNFIEPLKKLPAMYISFNSYECTNYKSTIFALHQYLSWFLNKTSIKNIFPNPVMSNRSIVCSRTKKNEVDPYYHTMSGWSVEQVRTTLEQQALNADKWHQWYGSHWLLGTLNNHHLKLFNVGLQQLWTLNNPCSTVQFG